MPIAGDGIEAKTLGSWASGVFLPDYEAQGISPCHGGYNGREGM
jgi:hypothetical protein